MANSFLVKLLSKEKKTTKTEFNQWQNLHVSKESRQKEYVKKKYETKTGANKIIKVNIIRFLISFVSFFFVVYLYFEPRPM